jgi:hypothetical protein
MKKCRFVIQGIFMIMGKKVKHIRIRITEAQFRWLADVLITEQRTKSAVIRDALNNYLLEECHRNEIKENKKNQNR